MPMKTDARTIEAVGLDNRQVLVRELTMADMRALVRAREGLDAQNDGAESASMDLMDLLLVEDGLLFSDLGRLTDLSAEDLDRLTEADVGRIVAAAKEANPRFFDQVIGVLGRFARANLGDAAQTSSAGS